MVYAILLPSMSDLIGSHKQAPEKSEMTVSWPEFSQGNMIETDDMTEQKPA